MKNVPSVVSARGADATARARSKASTAMPLEQTGNRAVDQLQANGAAASAPARSDPYKRVYFEAVAFTANVPLALQHKLGRKYKGARVSAPDQAATFRRDTTLDAQLAAIQVTLIASNTCTADVEVYG